MELPVPPVPPGEVPLFRRLALCWPAPAAAGPDPLAAPVRALREGRGAMLHPVLGELFSLQVRV
jgi:hypothetical protein